jgi:hypothetical protein
MEEKSAKNLARKRNHNKEPSQSRFDGGYGITSRCISFGSPVANRCAHSDFTAGSS